MWQGCGRGEVHIMFWSVKLKETACKTLARSGDHFKMYLKYTEYSTQTRFICLRLGASDQLS